MTPRRGAWGRGPRGGEVGFTLLELLVAMTLLGLVVTILFGGLRLGVRVWEAGAARSDARAGVEIAQRFVRDALGRAHPLAKADQRAARKVAFAGRADEVEFAALMPEHLSAGGFNQVTFTLSDDDDDRDLVVRFALLEPDDDGSMRVIDEKNAQEAVLLKGIASAKFAYFGATRSGDAPDWHDEWQDMEVLPRLVRLRVTFPDGDRRVWPDLLVAPRSSEGWDTNFASGRPGLPEGIAR